MKPTVLTTRGVKFSMVVHNRIGRKGGRNMRWCVLTTFVLACAMLAGCGSDVDSTCEINDDCVAGRLCGSDGECLQRDPVRIVTESLPDATVDAEYSFTLEATDGISPYTWSLTEKPDWMSIDAETGTLSGTPDQVATGLAVTVRVEDSTTGRDSYNLAELSIDVNLCSEGDTTVCYEPSEGKCLEGIKRCSGGDWGPCGDAAFSTNKDRCGADCSACDEQISDRCDRGACACGDGAPCTGDEICCEATCVDPLTDTYNCGACGNDCTVAMQNASNPHCEDGICVYDGCAIGFLDCNSVPEDGCEIAMSVTQCGACDRDCSTVTQHVAEVLCVDSAGTFDCGYQGDGTQGEGCEFGHLDCDTLRANGCETLASSQTHCGFCGNVCDALCRLHPDGDRYYCGCYQDSDCGPGRQCCGDVCVALDDPAHCGSCDNDCILRTANVAEALCVQGACDYTDCLPLYLDCDVNRQNGCETPMSNENCGACGFSCGAFGECVDGSCACIAERGNCNDDWDDGCETYLVDNLVHCGSCAIDCTVQVQGASNALCLGVLCDYGTCNADWDDCDADRTNGCEADLMGDEQNCGACSVVCQRVNGNNFCNSGICQPICFFGWGDCDGIPHNGCEDDLQQTDHCGTNCGNTVDCNVQIQNAQAPTCDNGLCDYMRCTGSYEDCDGDRTNGCETNTDTSVNNCGSCGRGCAPDPYCCDGVCSLIPC